MNALAKNISVRSFIGKNKPLYDGLKDAMSKAIAVDISVSFIMESGVKLLKNDLKILAERAIPVRILVGEYLNVTHPQALYLLKDILGDNLEMHFYKGVDDHFHPKAYFFHYKNESEVFIGSSNMSISALTTGIEWNYRLSSKENYKEYDEFYEEFLLLFQKSSVNIDEKVLLEYARNWVAPKITNKGKKTIAFSEDENEVGQNANVIPLFEPKGAQIEALYLLKQIREEGADKGLVVAATGVGKTYLAAFDTLGYEKVLFVAHREEILRQANQTFKNLFPEKQIGYFNSENKDMNVDFLFASIQTLGKQKYLDDKYFSRTYFDYIVVDEFHHAAADNYRNLLNYFTPKFLLGLTATPDRMDNKDVYRLCDYNLVYEANLFNAINRDWLVPFRYYGIYDSTNYETIEFKNGKYNEIDLEQALMLNQRGDLILEHYRKYNFHRALGFCSTQNHAIKMKDFFNDAGIASEAIISGAGGSDRKKALANILKGKTKVIFAVDMLSEGVDIPSIDMVMFLRPTESPTVFLQQLGRGLRKYDEKKYLNVLDFIGNYKKAYLIPNWLIGKNVNENGFTSDALGKMEEMIPEDCRIDFDFRIIDIMEKQRSQILRIEDLAKQEYDRIKGYLEHIPSRSEYFTYVDDDIYIKIRSKSDVNPVRDYFGFLDSIGELGSEERELKDSFAGEFIGRIEKTSMTKMYKLPLLLAFYRDNAMHMSARDKDIAASFRKFYRNPSNAMDMKKDKSSAGFEKWADGDFVRLARNNPIKFLLQSEGKYFCEKDGKFCLADELKGFCDNSVFVKNVLDAIELRRIQFYKERYEAKYPSGN